MPDMPSIAETPMPFFGGLDVHTLRVELLHVEPPVWRRIVVPSETKLPQLSLMFEAAMGWEGYHMHSMEVAGLQFGLPDEEFDFVIDDQNITVMQVLPRVGASLRWLYDFGDGWEHHVVVEAIAAPDAQVRYPLCTAGEQACPPEDCGGPPGYDHLRAVLADPDHVEYEDLRPWAGEGFDPTAFDLAAASRRLQGER